jgi:hypothetical protein
MVQNSSTIVYWTTETNLWPLGQRSGDALLTRKLQLFCPTIVAPSATRRCAAPPLLKNSGLGIHDMCVARSKQVWICIGWKQLSYSIYLHIASDLSTQCLSRQQQADGPLETGNHILTDITVGIRRPQ